MRRHAGLELLLGSLRVAFPGRCLIHRFGTAAAYFCVNVKDVPVVRIRVQPSDEGLSAELLIAGIATEVSPMYAYHTGPIFGAAGYDVVVGGAGRMWQFVPSVRESDAPAVLASSVDERWLDFACRFRQQWQSAPDYWLECAESVVALPDFAESFLPPHATGLHRLSPPESVTPTLETAAEAFLLAALGFGGLGQRLLPAETPDRLARLHKASAAARLRMSSTELMWNPLGDDDGG